MNLLKKLILKSQLPKIADLKIILPTKIIRLKKRKLLRLKDPMTAKSLTILKPRPALRLWLHSLVKR